MNIKNLKPGKNSKYHYSHYTPINDYKYNGARPIICRSSYEYKFCVYCDTTKEIISWSSESLKIKYEIKNRFGKVKYHTYFPDYFITVKKNGIVKKYLIEVKPYSETLPPKQPKNPTNKALKNYRYKVNTYIKNWHKFKAAEKVSKAKGWEFKVITEKWLNKI